jgi:hypothetical protein
MANKGSWVLRAETSVVDKSEILTLYCLRSGKVALKTAHDKYVTATHDRDGRDWVLWAHSDGIKASQRFALYDVDTEQRVPCRNALDRVGQNQLLVVGLRTIHRRYVTAMDDQQGWDWELRAETRNLYAWEEFMVVTPTPPP